MSDSKLVMPEKGTGKGKQKFDASRAWALLGWVGLTFLVVGGADFALTWYPMDFGNREWEFGTVTASFNGLPILVLGLGLLLTSSLLTDRRWWLIVATVGAFGLLLWVLVGAAIWAATVPVAMSSTPAEVLVGLKKALVKTAVQSVTYPVILAFLGWRGVQAIRGNNGSGSVA